MTLADASVSRFATKYNKTFFYISKYCGKKQISTGLPWCGLLFTTIYVITWSKFVVDHSAKRLVSPQHFDHVMT